MNKEKELEKFDLWLEFLPDHINFMMLDRPELKECLDYSLASLEYLESFILQEYETLEKLRDNYIWHERFAMYLGEVMVKSGQYAWHIQLNSKEPYYKLPVIKKEGETKDIILCPFYLVKDIVRLRSGNILHHLHKTKK